MTTFCLAEGVSSCNLVSFAQAIMQVQLRFGIAHTLILDRDSKVFATFQKTCELLNLNVHILSSGNHDAMIAERVNRFLNSGMKNLCQDQGSTMIGCKTILLLIYAWNSAPVMGTDLSRSLLTVGREFRFPIDISTNKHITGLCFIR